MRNPSKRRKILAVSGDAYYRDPMADYWSIEVFNGSGSSAMAWRQSYGAALVESALSNGASEWSWVETRWGVVLEVAFAEESDWLRFRGLPAVRAALDGVPTRSTACWCTAAGWVLRLPVAAAPPLPPPRERWPWRRSSPSTWST
jgi:hypothetical protein